MSDKAITPETFEQKRVGHIFHYTKTLKSLLSIFETGFQSSYCKEEIGELKYLIPMVSFCNIPIQDVSFYMRYGDYGIGMSIDWAIGNKISPVIYVHANSPFSDLHNKINRLLLWDMVGTQFERYHKIIDEAVAKGEMPDTSAGVQKEEDTNLLAAINEATVPALQFFKNWKVEYYGREIITYQEREWRFIPALEQGKKIISSSEEEYNHFIDEKQKPKPHLPESALRINSVEDIRYIIIRDNSERRAVFDNLSALFGAEAVLDTIVGGRLLILTSDQIRHDF